jgi:hypothetical protein
MKNTDTKNYDIIGCVKVRTALSFYTICDGKKYTFIIYKENYLPSERCEAAFCWYCTVNYWGWHIRIDDFSDIETNRAKLQKLGAKEQVAQAIAEIISGFKFKTMGTLEEIMEKVTKN